MANIRTQDPGARVPLRLANMARLACGAWVLTYAAGFVMPTRTARDPMLARDSAQASMPRASSDTFIAASDPSITYVGRTQVNADGSRTFDWEAVSVLVSVTNCRYVKAVISADSVGGISGRTKFVVDEPWASLEGTSNFSQGFSITEFWVDADAGALSNNTYYAASGLDVYANYTIRLFNALEPDKHGNTGPGYGLGTITFHGLWLDGSVLSPRPPTSRSLVWVGDSLTAGFGSRGRRPPCEVNQFTDSHYYSYSRYIGDALGAATQAIAWSGKGVYKNCCDDGETMPQYFLQTFGAGNFTADWDFSRDTEPSALVINLGSNDMSKYNGTQAYLTAFEDAFVSFALNATRVSYRNPAIPILVVLSPFNNTLLAGALQVVVSRLTTAGSTAFYLEAFPGGGTGTPDGCSGHPGVTWHEEMAQLLAPQIAAVLGW